MNPIDPDDGIALRTYLEALRMAQRDTRATWDALYSQLRAFFAPRNGRTDPSDANNGARQDFQIINETGLLSKRVLSSGMLTGMASPTREWFKLKAADESKDALPEVRQWCEGVEERVRATMLKSNFYQALLELFDDEGLFGTGAFLIEQDPKTDIRCHPYPNMSYTLGVNDALRVDLVFRELSMTARQIVDKFGRENTSDAVLTVYDSPSGGSKENPFTVTHVIMPGSYFGESKKGKPVMPWVSVWYELGSFNAKVGILRRSGFMENPMVVGRWRTVGENIYGESPAMDILGSVMSLQAWEERLAQAAEKQFNPPMVASTAMDPRRLTTLPGEFSFVNDKDATKAFAPAYQIDFKLAEGMSMVDKIERRINDGMFVSVFQMFSSSDRRDQTAEEVRAKQQEKMQVLGPVIERNMEEVLATSIKRILAIMFRIPGRLPPMPDALKAGDTNSPLALEFESILASAQKMVRLNNINAVAAFAGQEAALNAGVLDVLDWDETMREYAKDASMPNKCIRPPEVVNKIRADKARAQQQQALMENAKNLASAAQVASQTPTNGGNLLQAVAPGIAGGVQQ